MCLWSAIAKSLFLTGKPQDQWSLCDCKQNFRSIYSVVVWSLRDCENRTSWLFRRHVVLPNPATTRVLSCRKRKRRLGQ